MYINKLYYINLENRIDRDIHFLNEINTFLPHYKDKVERFTAIRHTIGSIGCTLSHISVLKKALQENHKYIIIFEDDFKFCCPISTLENNLVKLFNEKIIFNVIMLSYNSQSQRFFR